MGQLMKFTERELMQKFEEKTGRWLYNIARGIDLEPVRTRLIPKSISCCKRFPGKNCLVSPESVERWVNELAIEISERLEKDMEENTRKAKQIVVSFAQSIGDKNVSSSRTLPMNSYDQFKIGQDFLNVLRKFCCKSNGTYNNITYLGMSAGNFQNIHKNSNIKYFFKNPVRPDENISEEITNSSKKSTASVVNTSANNQIFVNEEFNLSLDNHQENTAPGNNNIDFKGKEFQHPTEMSNNVVHSLCTRASELKGSPKVKTKTESFFNKYFKNNTSINDPHSMISNISNDKNESKTEIEVSTRLDEKEMSSADKSQGAFCSSENEINASTNVCEPSSDYMKQVKLENSRNPEPQSNGHHGVKRKAGQIKPMLKFLQKYDDLNEDNSEYCPECKKRIKFEDIIFHTDYHTARQLHQQINCSQAKNLTECSTKKGRLAKSKTKSKNGGNIMRFFNINIP